ncbi:MAG TPA: two-component regulator propeller domain-containing protein, partial [Chthonomonadaceae bacterium]|nr:two-component regulator propeller domain-containing protein [Chthonomonadaceae bacterium]
MRFWIALLLPCLLGWACGALGAPIGAAKPYPQLVATRYPAGVPLPPGITKPSAAVDFVDRSKLPAGAEILSAAHTARGAEWVVTNKGSFRRVGGAYQPLEPPRLLKPHQPSINEDTFVRCVVADRDGHLWAGTTAGVYATDGANWWHTLDRRDGMPIENVLCLYAAPNGDLWGGTEQGAWRLRAGGFRYFAGLRWLPGDKVKAIWGDGKGRVWLETDGGYACIEEKMLTLGQKALAFNEVTQKWNNRRGYINERTLKMPGELAGSVFEVSDNDGLWNAIYVGAMTFRYAATKDPEAKRQAWECLKAMLELERLTGISGFPARAVVTDAELAAGDTGFDPKETVRVPGETDPIWFRSKVEKDVWCKGDTSSDELDGHYFSWLVYFDLAATDDEKRQIAATCRRVTDNILAGDYNLIGHTGRKTLWGVFAPETLNDDPAWWDQRPLNSLELLGYMKVAAHITGDPKYTRHYETLIRDHHYLLNILENRKGYFGEWQNINHSDDEMAYMMYYALLTLEKDPDRRRLLLQSFRTTWEENGVDQTLKPEHSPLYNYFYGGLSGRPCAPEEAEETLQDWPWDRVEWSMRNSQRADVTFKQGRGLHAVSELTRVLPISERSLHRWNG